MIDLVVASVSVDHALANAHRGRVLDGLPESVTYEELVRRRIRSAASLTEAALALLQLFSEGIVVQPDGTLLLTRVRVATLNGLRIDIRTREHGPAHFHVTAPGLNASFAIADCALLAGEPSGKDRRLVEFWHASARALLVKTWNETRPSDCPVGPITE